MASKELAKIQDELKWVQVRENNSTTFFEKLKSKGIMGVLVPTGCLITAGVLLRGLYFMTQRNQKGQQLMMRYRVGAQGVTVFLALISMFSFPFIKNK